jgi:hypothetical protein
VYTLLQLLTVHYNTCRVFTLYLHWLPVFQYRRIRSPATLQLFSKDCCSARILTRNCNCPIPSRAIQPVNRPQRKHRLRFLYCMKSSPERTPEKTWLPPLLPRDGPQRKRFHCCVVVHCCAFIRCHSNGCQHMPYCLQHARHIVQFHR